MNASPVSGPHPLFASILAVHGLAQREDTVLELRRSAYVAALNHMDWEFEQADDYHVWSKGRDELVRLRAERKAVDADGALWRLHAAENYKCEVPA